MTINNVDLSEVKEGSDLHFLIEKLNCVTTKSENVPINSIMHYRQICIHDDGYLCEHRLQYIIEQLKNSSLNG